jgi:hypothetical protein
MQASASGVTNPLLKQASTVGAPFWFVLASTTDAARTTTQSPVPGQPTAQQDSGGTQNPAAQAEANPGQNTDASIAAQTNVAQDAPLAAAISANAKATVANAAVAQGATRTTPVTSPMRRPASTDGKSDDSINSPISGAALPNPPAIIPQIPTPVQQPVTAAAPATTDSAQDAQTSAASSQSASPVEATSLAGTMHTTVPTIDQPANETGDTKAPAQESTTTEHPSTGVPAFALSPNAATIPARSETTSSASQQASTAASAQASPSTSTRDTNAATNTTDAKTQSDSAKNAAAARALGIGLPQALTAETAPASTPTSQSDLSPSSVLPFLPALPVDTNAFAKTVQSAASDATSTNATSTAATTKTTPVDSTPATSDKSTHAQSTDDSQTPSQTTALPAQHAPDTTQAVTGKIADAAPLQAITTHAGLRDTATTETNRSSDTARTSESTRTETPLPPDGSEPTAASGINAARLIQTLNETGMQVGMHSAEFGDISIRTLVSQQQMTAQIAVDHGDLGRAIAANVPTMQTKLGDDLGMRAFIQVHQSGASFSGEQGNTSGGQQKAYGAPTQVGSISLAAEVETAGLSTAVSEGNRLDIRA